MTKLKEIQTALDKMYPNAWHATQNQTGFCLRRADSVELITMTELTSIGLRFRGFQAYVTLEPRTNYAEDGYDLAVWLMSFKTIHTRKPRKPDRRASERRDRPRRISDKAKARLRK